MPIYSPLLTDFYQFTMAYGYYKLGMHEQEASFHLLFRKNPFQSHYAIACGLGTVLPFLKNWRFNDADLDYLSSLKNIKGELYFSKDFIDYLTQLTFNCEVAAIPEGSIVFAHTPLFRIQGPLLQCQLIESSLLNIINFQTLIATKASRIVRAADGGNVIEFGMRRAQGPDGALSASRAAYIGGCVATSNTLAGKIYDIPVKGTHAHSWVTAFSSEQEAFNAYASIMPNNSILLVDTYNTIEGVKHAIQTGLKLRAQGSELSGIRLDSGNMATLSIQARQLLDEAGLHNTAIIASNSLDEYVIADLKKRGAKIDSWGVGTHLATAYDQPALDGIYKLGALKNATGTWAYKLKLSEEKIKTSNPGRHQVRRFYKHHVPVLDVIYDLDLGINEHSFGVGIETQQEIYYLNNYDEYEDLLISVLKDGSMPNLESIHAVRERTIANYILLDKLNFPYPIALEQKLAEKKRDLVARIKNSYLTST